MPVRPHKRLPRKLRRPVTPATRSLVSRRYDRHKKLRREQWIRRFRRFRERVSYLRKHILLASLLAIVLGGCTFFALALFSPIMRLTEVRIVQTDPRLDLEQAQQALSPLFGKHLLLISPFDVRQLLRSEVPDLESVTVTKDYPSALLIKVALDPVIARLRIETPDEEDTATGSSIDFLTAEGVYVASSRVGGVDSLPLIHLVDWGVRPVHGTKLIDPEFLARMDAADLAIREQFGQAVSSHTIYLRAQEFHLQSPQWALWFDTRSSIEDHLARYRTFLREVPPGEAKEYVDLRLKDRVVYR